MDTRIYADVKERNSAWSWFATALLFGFGSGLVYIESFDWKATEWSKSVEWMKPIVSSLGATMVGAALVSTLWELKAKRKFADELFTIADISNSVRNAGIVEVRTTGFYELPWVQFFNESKTLTVFVSYARTWRNANREHVKSFLSKAGTQLTLCFPNPNDELTMNELGRRFNTDAEDLRKRIQEAIAEFGAIAKEAGKYGESRLKIKYVGGVTPIATYYLFDNVAVFTLYTHCKEKKPVPSFIVGKGGELFKCVEEEIKAILAVAIQAVVVEPNAQAPPTPQPEESPKT